MPGRCGRWWLRQSVADLAGALAALGSRLIIRRTMDSTAELVKVRLGAVVAALQGGNRSDGRPTQRLRLS